MSVVSSKASLYGNIEIGENVRIDDFCILTGNIKIGNNIHIGCFSFFSGGYGIELEDYAQIAPRTTILSASDDYMGNSLVGPQVPDEFKPRLKTGKVLLKRHVLIGAHSIVMPGVTLGEGVSVGALSFVNRSLDPWTVYCGIPARRIRTRSQDMLELEEAFSRQQKKKGWTDYETWKASRKTKDLIKED